MLTSIVAYPADPQQPEPLRRIDGVQAHHENYINGPNMSILTTQVLRFGVFNGL